MDPSHVFVTGGAGKLGGYVVRELVRGGHRVTVFDLKPTAEPRVRHVLGDMLDLPSLEDAMDGADVVVHLAAIPIQGVAPDDVTVRTNLMGTYNAHEAARRLDIERVISTSSEATLGWDFHERPFVPDYLPVDEDHRLRAQDSYGLSKILGEAVARSFTERCGMETVAVRPGWILSPEEIEAFRRQGGYDPPYFKLCSYVDVRDLAVAYRLAVECPLPGHSVFFAVADDTIVAEPLAVVFPRLLPGIGDMAKDFTSTRPALSNARAKALLGWRPMHSWRSPG
jgi:nucleoside-diphosphate-sugar epimerase